MACAGDPRLCHPAQPGAAARAPARVGHQASAHTAVLAPRAHRLLFGEQEQRVPVPDGGEELLRAQDRLLLWLFVLLHQLDDRARHRRGLHLLPRVRPLPVSESDPLEPRVRPLPVSERDPLKPRVRPLPVSESDPLEPRVRPLP
eukprot:1180301-Prorocentrum_minimum.AAC.1